MFTDLKDLCNEVSFRYYELLNELQNCSDFNLELEGLKPNDFKLTTRGKIINPNVGIWNVAEIEFTKNLIWFFNGFCSRLYRLSLLDKLINEYDKDKERTLRYEFTEVLSHYCLLKPSEFVDRVKYMMNVLCHQASLAVDSNYNEKSFKTNDFEKHSKNWQTLKPLLKSLEYIGNHNIDSEYTTKTYRNKSQHEISRSIDWGITNLVNRNKSNGVIHYQMGGFESIKTENVISILIVDGKAMRDAFLCYWDLVNEQNEAFISAKYLSNDQ